MFSKLVLMTVISEMSLIAPITVISVKSMIALITVNCNRESLEPKKTYCLALKTSGAAFMSYFTMLLIGAFI
jgi:hypothetical protein